jgi:class 3 adenylate cyclase
LLAEAVDELGHLTQALEIEQMICSRKGSRGGGVVRGAEGDGSMAAIGQADDDVRALAVPDADDG